MTMVWYIVTDLSSLIHARHFSDLWYVCHGPHCSPQDIFHVHIQGCSNTFFSSLMLLPGANATQVYETSKSDWINLHSSVPLNYMPIPFSLQSWYTTTFKFCESTRNKMNFSHKLYLLHSWTLYIFVIFIISNKSCEHKLYFVYILCSWECELYALYWFF